MGTFEKRRDSNSSGNGVQVREKVLERFFYETLEQAKLSRKKKNSERLRE